MFQAWAVKMAKIDAHSRPSDESGNRATKNVTVTVRNPSTGTDCRMSSIGIRTTRARRSRAAAVPYTKVNNGDRPSAMNMRSSERAA